MKSKSLMRCPKCGSLSLQEKTFSDGRKKHYCLNAACAYLMRWRKKSVLDVHAPETIQ